MKTAWIFPGGSARGVYTAGALYALCNMNVEKPDIIIAASSSAPTSLCYLSGQYEIIPGVWLNSLSTKKFVSLWRFWKMINIDYLVDDIIKNKYHLDMKKVAESDVVAYLPLTDSKTGKIEYISNKTKLNMWEVIRASIFVPIWADFFSIKGIRIGDKFFSDSSPSSRFQLHVQKAIEEGAERIIVFDSWHDADNPTTYFVSKVFAYLHGAEFRKNQLAYINQVENFVVPVGIEFIRICPPTPLRMSRIEIDNANARKIFQRGYDDTSNNPQLKDTLVK